MKKALALTLLACGMAFGQDAAAPKLDLTPVVTALQAENTWLKRKIELLQQKLAGLNFVTETQNQLNDHEAKKPKPEAIPVPVVQP